MAFELGLRAGVPGNFNEAIDGAKIFLTEKKKKKKKKHDCEVNLKTNMGYMGVFLGLKKKKISFEAQLEPAWRFFQVQMPHGLDVVFSVAENWSQKIESSTCIIDSSNDSNKHGISNAM